MIRTNIPPCLPFDPAFFVGARLDRLEKEEEEKGERRGVVMDQLGGCWFVCYMLRF